ncbi:MAG: isoaspartyl peptidase/L-asparaginase [Planctomycetes bacterium]|nr:isoaspartyl peptidase/L-asparaginase [Planctomycetota bacterium]
MSACTSTPPVDTIRWAIAIHGGAGTLDPNAPAAEQRAYEEALTRALAHGRDMLARGAAALDVCEEVVRVLEDDPLFNAGVGAVFNEQGEHELDASIMDGSTLRCGACAGVRTVRHPVTLARRVMTDTRHVLLAGEGADRFAESIGLERVPNTFFDTERRRRALEQVLKERERTGALLPSDPQHRHGTVGCVVRDRDGRLAAATSTGGMTGKRWGRVGDTPVLGAGNYADGFAAISCTGTGEEFIRHGVARAVAARMQFGGQTLAEAVHALIFETLQKDDGGLIAVDAEGNLVADYNSTGMYRGMADSRGRFEVRIFRDEP